VDIASLDPEIAVVRVPAYSPHAVAEYALALMLTLNRKTHRAYYRTRDNNFSLTGLVGFDMHGKTAGIIGTGKIGRITAELLRGLGMRVLAHDLYPNHQWAEQNGIEYVEQAALYRRSDIISLHCPLTPENLYMINKGTLSLMKSNVIIVNTGRGKLINSSDLLDALKNRTIGGAALDVYEEETQYFFEDHSTRIMEDDVLARLMTFPNVLVTSHQAFFTHEALENIAETTLENVRLFFDAGEMPNRVEAA
jgi:D-lactate dehydrogenase